MNIFEKKIAEKYGVPESQTMGDKKITLDSIIINNGIPIFNYIVVLQPATIEAVTLDFKFDFSKDDL